MQLYEIVLDGPYGEEVIENKCTLKEARFNVSEYRISDPTQRYFYRRERRIRYYVSPAGGAWYDPEELKPLVTLNGGFNVRTARQFGWANQPEVVTFSCFEGDERFVSAALDHHGYMTIIKEKDWS
jgi:hypothetical protein